YWNGAATYYRGIIKALYQHGHSITFYEPDAYERQQHRDIPDPDWARVFVYPASTQGLESALNDAYGADLTIKASGVGVFDAELEAAVTHRRPRGSGAFFGNANPPATLERVQNDPADSFLPLIPQYDLILTYGGGQPVVKDYEALGAVRCVPIYNGFDPE